MKSIGKKISSAIFFGLLFICLIGFYWLFYTTSGLVWILDKSNKTIEGKIEYQNAQGALLKTVTFDHFRFVTPALELRVFEPSIKINIKDILSRSLEITSFSAANLEFLQKATAKQQRPGTDRLIMPIDISIRSLDIDKFTFHREQQAPIVVTGIVLRDSEIAHRVVIGTLSATSSFGSINVQGEFEPSLQGEIALATDFSISSGKQSLTYKGHADLSGKINHLSVSANLLSPYLVSLNGKVDLENDNPVWDLQAQAPEFSLAPHYPSIPLSLEKTKITSQGTIGNFSINGVSKLLHDQYGSWAANISISKKESQWEVITASLSNQDTNSRLQVSGTVLADYNFSEFTNFTIDSTWNNLLWPLSEAPVIQSDSGTFSAKGNYNEYQLLSTGDFTWNKNNFNNIKLAAQGNTNKVKFTRIDADIYGGHIQGTGSLELGKNLFWDANAALRSINLKKFNSNLQSNLSGKLQINGDWREQKVSSTIILKQVKGTLGSHPLAGQAKISFTDNAVNLDGLSIRSGDSHIKADFHLTPGEPAKPYTIKANWDLAISNIGMLDKVSRGNIESRGVLHGSMDQLNFAGKLLAHDVQVGAYSIENLQLDTNIDSTDAKRSHLSLDASKLSIKDVSLNSVRLDAAGKTASHDIKAQIVQSVDTTLILTGTGAIKEKQWHITLNTTDLQSKQFGNWQQNKTSQLALSANSLLLEEHCLVNTEQGVICAVINSQDYSYWGGTLDFIQVPFSTFHKLLPQQFSSTKVNLDGLITFFYAPNAGVLLDFRASGNNGIVGGIEIEKTKKQIAFKRFEFNLSNMYFKLDTNASIAFQDGGSINASLIFPNWTRLSLPDLKESIRGNVNINLNNIAVLAIISDYIKDPVGSWRSGFSISGTVETPLVLGKSQIAAGSLTLPTLGLKLRDVDLIADSNANRTVMIAGSAQSGDGKITINGYFDDYRAQKTSGLLRIKGEKFQLVKIPEATIVVSPDLKLALSKNAVDIQGDIVITDADFKVFAPTTTLAPSPDVVIVSQEDSSPLQADIKIASKIRIVLGKNVKIQGYGFSGRLEGSVLVDDTDALTTGSGEIHILDGKYVAYGKELQITHGELSFANSAIDNPLINVLATRQPGENVVVGVKIEGQVKSPSINLYSEPAMEDSDILSYIILGHPLSEASNKDGELLTKAAASLGLIGGEKLAKKLATKFGIDEVKLQTDHTTQDTSLLLGKYLSPDFYVGYAIGIGSAVNTLQMQYKLTDQWVLKTQSGEQQKAEILFTIEKD